MPFNSVAYEHVKAFFKAVAGQGDVILVKEIETGLRLAGVPEHAAKAVASVFGGADDSVTVVDFVDWLAASPRGSSDSQNAPLAFQSPPLHPEMSTWSQLSQRPDASLRSSNLPRALIVIVNVCDGSQGEFEKIIKDDVIGQREEEPGNTFTDLFRVRQDSLAYVWAEGWKDGAAQAEHAKTEWYLAFDRFRKAGNLFNMEVKWFFAPSEDATIAEAVAAIHHGLDRLDMQLAYCDLGDLPGKDASHEPFLVPLRDSL